MHRLYDSFEVSDLFPVFFHAIVLAILHLSPNKCHCVGSLFIDLFEFLFGYFVVLFHALFEFCLMLLVVEHGLFTLYDASLQ